MVSSHWVKFFHLVSTLLLVLVVDTLLSPAKLKVPLIWGSEVILDLSNIPILIAASFLMGSSPRPLWNLIERFTRALLAARQRINFCIQK